MAWVRGKIVAELGFEGERKKKDSAEFAENAEDAERNRRRERSFVALDRKSPPSAKSAKGGAPSSIFVGGATKSTARNGCATGDTKRAGQARPLQGLRE
jgi:hypothetical protein